MPFQSHELKRKTVREIIITIYQLFINYSLTIEQQTTLNAM